MKIQQVKKYIQLYDTEKCLFEVVGPSVKQRGRLLFDDFYKIAMWKSVRPKKRYVKNESVVEEVSKRAFSEKDEVKKIQILCELNGVAIPTASAILTVVYPEKYAVIDVRCLEVLRGKFNFKIGKSMSIKTWRKYTDIMRGLATENNITPRELDMALFAMHREMLDAQDFRNLY